MRLLVGVCALAVAVALSSPAPAQQTTGAGLYKSKCAACHGADGKGQTAMGKKMNLRDLGSEEVQKQHDSEWRLIIEQGKGKMPAYKGKLSEKDIESVLVYMRSFKQK